MSHPRFYWGEAGNVLTPPLFKIPIPASRRSVPTGYGFVLPDRNGWSRRLHFEAAWAVVLTGIVYVGAGLVTGRMRRNLLPVRTDLGWGALSTCVRDHLRPTRLRELADCSYNSLQRLTYLLTIFILFPLAIWTGLAMSPAVASAVPASVVLLGGQQSARTIHFFVSLFLIIFLVVHVAMICVAGFRSRMRAMITGRL